MPAYPLRCTKCDNKEERTMSITEFCSKDHICSVCDATLVRDYSVKHDVGVVDNTDTRKGYYNSKEGHHR